MDEDSDWERFVVPNLPKLVDCLRASLVLDHLRAKRLVAKEEYGAVRALPTEEERARRLFEILPTKGEDSYKQFCTILRGIPGQSHIVTEILRKTEEQYLETAVSASTESHDSSTSEQQKSNGTGHTAVIARVEQVRHNGEGDHSDISASEVLASPTKKCKYDDTETDAVLCSYDTQRAPSDTGLESLGQLLDQQITDKQMDVIKSLGGSKWRQLGRSLGYSDEDITEIVSQYMNEGIREKLHQILCRWKSRNGDKATLRKLLDACSHQDVDIKADVVSRLVKQMKK